MLQSIIICFALVCRSTTVSVKITVQDINDNLPIFGKHFYTVTVTEATAVNTTILTVQVRGKIGLYQTELPKIV